MLNKTLEKIVNISISTLFFMLACAIIIGTIGMTGMMLALPA